jgi:hypothetical protein
MQTNVALHRAQADRLQPATIDLHKGFGAGVADPG